MNWIAEHVWCVPLLPLVAAGVIALTPREAKRFAMFLAIGSMAGALVLSLWAFASTLSGSGAMDGEVARTAVNFDWFALGTGAVRLGFVLDPLGAAMLAMVSVVGLLIFVFSVGYMEHDDNVTRFFGFMTLFASAMLGLVIANSLLLFFVCWELMGVASYLLIGFWFQRPAAAAAAKKAFIVTRIGDLGLFLGMLWLFNATGTLLFYDGGRGCLEAEAVGALAGAAAGSMSVATAISLLLFLGAVGKSGQLPLHVWLPDAMEGPTPVSALIHAATMVAAGVFLVARAYPLMCGGADAGHGAPAGGALSVVTAVGAATAFFAALVAVAQSDIKRILAYSTVSQLGYMFVGLGVGGVAVGIFHLLTHAFFKALLFLGAGSVIHGCSGEQDIRRMGGLRRLMPWTFAFYAAGMMALAGVPLLFSGFWSKDEILHAAWHWGGGRWAFYLVAITAALTAFYMTRQTAEVFFGPHRGGSAAEPARVHESPAVMLGPLAILAVFAVVPGFVGTPAWPWLQGYLEGHSAELDLGRLAESAPMMGISVALVAAGMGAGWWWHARSPRKSAEEPDPLETGWRTGFRALERRLYVDDVYDATVTRGHGAFSSLMAWADEFVIGGLVVVTGFLFRGLGGLARWLDEQFVNAGFDAGCGSMRLGARLLSAAQSGRVQRYLAMLGMGMVALMALIVWGLGGE